MMNHEEAKRLAKENPGTTMRRAPNGDGWVVIAPDGTTLLPNQQSPHPGPIKQPSPSLEDEVRRLEAKAQELRSGLARSESQCRTLLEDNKRLQAEKDSQEQLFEAKLQELTNQLEVCQRLRQEEAKARGDLGSYAKTQGQAVQEAQQITALQHERDRLLERLSRCEGELTDSKCKLKQLEMTSVVVTTKERPIVERALAKERERLRQEQEGSKAAALDGD